MFRLFALHQAFSVSPRATKAALAVRYRTLPSFFGVLMLDILAAYWLETTQ